MSPKMSAALFCLPFLVATPASAVTVANGVVLFNQADALAGNVTPGDAPGFPVTLSATGSYRLAGNLLPTAGNDGIEVTGPEVTIDMFGFRLAGSGAALNGVVGKSRALTVRNGTIRGFTENGIVTSAEFLTVEDMRIVDNVDAGVRDVFATGTADVSPPFGNQQHHIQERNRHRVQCKLPGRRQYDRRQSILRRLYAL